MRRRTRERPDTVETLSPAEIFQAWHLIRGGMEDAGDISKCMGKRIYKTSLPSIRHYVNELLRGPFELNEPVRCGGCGAKIHTVPCCLCGPKKAKYRKTAPVMEDCVAA